MVYHSHLDPSVTSIMEGVVALGRELPDGSLRHVVVYRIVSVVLIGEDPVPELVQIVQGFCQVGAPL